MCKELYVKNKYLFLGNLLSGRFSIVQNMEASNKMVCYFRYDHSPLLKRIITLDPPRGYQTDIMKKEKDIKNLKLANILMVEHLLEFFQIDHTVDGNVYNLTGFGKLCIHSYQDKFYWRIHDKEKLFIIVKSGIPKHIPEYMWHDIVHFECFFLFDEMKQHYLLF